MLDQIVDSHHSSTECDVGFKGVTFVENYVLSSYIVRYSAMSPFWLEPVSGKQYEGKQSKNKMEVHEVITDVLLTRQTMYVQCNIEARLWIIVAVEKQ
jgi:hypothetical protein